jgi:hypothetical protein
MTERIYSHAYQLSFVVYTVGPVLGLTTAMSLILITEMNWKDQFGIFWVLKSEVSTNWPVYFQSFW